MVQRAFQAASMSEGDILQAERPGGAATGARDSAGVPKGISSKERGFVGGSADARIHRRRSVLWPARLIVGSHEFRCQVWNMSVGGARIKIDVPLKAGTEVLLKVMGRADLPATIQWCEGEAAGLSFRISADEVRLLFMDRAQTLGLDDS